MLQAFLWNQRWRGLSHQDLLSKALRPRALSIPLRMRHLCASFASLHYEIKGPQTPNPTEKRLNCGRLTQLLMRGELAEPRCIRTQLHEVVSQSNHGSSNDPRMHFGVSSSRSSPHGGSWPRGTIEVHKNVASNQLIKLIERSAAISTDLKRMRYPR